MKFKSIQLEMVKTDQVFLLLKTLIPRTNICFGQDFLSKQLLPIYNAFHNVIHNFFT